MRRHLQAGLGVRALLVTVLAGGLTMGVVATAPPAGSTVAMGTTSGGVVSPVAGTTHTDFPDPSVTYSGSGSTYYAYGTGTSFLVDADWTDGGIGTTTMTCNTGNCTDESTRTVARTHLGTPASLDADFGLQAPSVVYLGGQWVMYYAGVYAPAGTGAYGVYYSTSSSPTSGFTNAGTETPLMYQRTTKGSTDPATFISPTGQPWLTWKSSTYATDGKPAHLWSMRLTTDGTAMKPGASAYQLATQPTSGWASATIENPQMVWSGGTYYLFYSGAHWNSTGYAEGYTTCSGPTGGCGTPATHEILSGTSSAPYGPGGGSLFTTTTGSWLMAFHGWNTSCTTYGSPCNGFRDLYVRPVSGLFSTSLPNISLFTASRYTVSAAGGTVTLNATATRAVSLTFSSSGGVAGLPKVIPTLSGGATDTVYVPVNTSTSIKTYTFTVGATGPYGGQVTARLTVRVAAATGQQAESSGSLVVRPTGEVDQVVRTPSNAIEYYWRPAGGTWSNANIGGTATNYAFSSPTMFVHNDGQEDIVFEGATHRLIYCYHFGTFTCETVAGPNVDFSTPSIFATPDQEVRVAYEGINNQLMYSYLYGSWTTLAISGDNFDYSAPSIFVSSSGEAVIANQGINNQLVVSTSTSDTHWVAGSVDGDNVAYSGPAVVVSRTGTIRVATEDINRQLLYSWLPSGGSWSSMAVGGDTVDFSIPSIGIKPSGQIEIVAEGINRQLMYNVLSGGSWSTIAIGGDTVDFSNPSIGVHNTGEVDIAVQGINRQLMYNANIPGWPWVTIAIGGDTVDID
jgi:Glycosyl hydrolases family 43